MTEAMMIVLPIIDEADYAQFAKLCSELKADYASWQKKVEAWKKFYHEPEYRVQWVKVTPGAFDVFLKDGSKPNDMNSLLGFAESVAGGMVGNG